jgi:hypothetical protein
MQPHARRAPFLIRDPIPKLPPLGQRGVRGGRQQEQSARLHPYAGNAGDCIFPGEVAENDLRTVGARHQGLPRPEVDLREGIGRRVAPEHLLQVRPETGFEFVHRPALGHDPHRGRAVERRFVEEPAGQPVVVHLIDVELRPRGPAAEIQPSRAHLHTEAMRSAVEGGGRQRQAEPIPPAVRAAEHEVATEPVGPRRWPESAVHHQPHVGHLGGKERGDPPLETVVSNAVDPPGHLAWADRDTPAVCPPVDLGAEPQSSRVREDAGVEREKRDRSAIALDNLRLVSRREDSVTRFVDNRKLHRIERGPRQKPDRDPAVEERHRLVAPPPLAPTQRGASQPL